MKFLSKKSSTLILQNGIVYKKGDNSFLLKELIKEQYNFCAYSEVYITSVDSPEIEHFNSAKKKTGDDYYNYYAVLRKLNLLKQDEFYQKEHKEGRATFFDSLFFQDKEQLNRRISYINGIYKENNPNDIEASQFLDFIGVNSFEILPERENHVKMLKEIFRDANYSNDQILDHFRKFKNQLSFITALEIELGIDLSEFYT